MSDFTCPDNTPPTGGAATNLTAADLAMFAGLGIPPDLLAQASGLRVTDAQARTDYGMMLDAHRDLSGIIFPYFSPVTGRRHTARLRRDNPEIDEQGKPRDKYISAYADPRHLYFPPGAAAKLEHPEIPVVLVEAEKSALALTAWAQRSGMDLIPIAMGGCYGWRGQRIRKEIAPNGERVDVAGPLPDLDYCDGHKVFVLLDANVASNDKVAAARAALVAELRIPARKCKVLIAELPATDGANGPDDYIGVAGDAAMGEVFEEARPPKPTPKGAKVVPMRPPAPVMPPLSSAAAAALTSELLEQVLAWITRYVVVSREQATILAVWVLHTYVMDAAEWTPYLHVAGPEKQCGKTLLMDTLAALACNPRTASGTSPAALLRVVDKWQPTLFLDEIDASTKGNKELAEAQRGILDAGFKRGGEFFKCDGKDNEVRAFSAFGPKCFAGIGDLPGTIASRSIMIEMRRKLRSERIERYRSRIVARLAAPIRAELERWGAGILDLLKGIEPQPIDALNDRANDVAEILLTIAMLAGGDWLQRLTTALLTVYGSDAADDTSVGVVLLTDIRDIFAERGAAHIPSKDLAAALCEIEGRPWPEWFRGRGLSANNLARLLKPYHVHPETIRVGTETAKGYRRADFADAWERYCAYTPPQNVTPPQPASPLAETLFLKGNAAVAVTNQKVPQTRIDIGLLPCYGSNGGGQAQEGISDTPAGPEEADEPPLEAVLGEQRVAAGEQADTLPEDATKPEGEWL